jgi:DHA1 family multidrug resistance protein-like MFS transporter
LVGQYQRQPIPYYRKNLYVLSFAVFLAGLSWNQVVPILPEFLKELGQKENVELVAGIVHSAHFLSSMIMMPIWGKLADRLGRKPMAIRAAFSLSLLYFIISLCTQPWHVFVCRFFNGVLTGFVPMSTALLACNTPKEIASRYVATLQSCSALGTIIGPVFGEVFSAIFGIRGAMRVSGTLVMISAIMVIIFVQEKNKPEKSLERTSLLSDFRYALTLPAMHSVLLISFAAALGSQSIQPTLKLQINHLLGANANPYLSGLIYAIPSIALAMTAARWVMALRRFQFKHIMLLAFIGGGIANILVGFQNTIYWFVLLLLVKGLFEASLRPIAASIVATEVEPSFQGRAFAIQNTANTFGGFIGPIAFGYLAGLLGNGSVFVAVGLILAICPLFLHSPYSTTEKKLQTETKGVS